LVQILSPLPNKSRLSAVSLGAFVISGKTFPTVFPTFGYEIRVTAGKLSSIHSSKNGETSPSTITDMVSRKSGQTLAVNHPNSEVAFLHPGDNNYFSRGMKEVFFHGEDDPIFDHLLRRFL